MLTPHFSHSMESIHFGAPMKKALVLVVFNSVLQLLLCSTMRSSISALFFSTNGWLVNTWICLGGKLYNTSSLAIPMDAGPLSVLKKREVWFIYDLYLLFVMLDTYSERFHFFSQTWNHLESDEAQKEKHHAQEQVAIVWSIEHVASDH